MRIDTHAGVKKKITSAIQRLERSSILASPELLYALFSGILDEGKGSKVLLLGELA